MARAGAEGAGRARGDQRDFARRDFSKLTLRRTFEGTFRSDQTCKKLSKGTHNTRRTRGLLQPARHESMKNVRFMFRGMRVEEAQTLAGLRLDMEDGDGIEVHGVF